MGFSPLGIAPTWDYPYMGLSPHRIAPKQEFPHMGLPSQGNAPKQDCPHTELPPHRIFTSQDSPTGNCPGTKGKNMSFKIKVLRDFAFSKSKSSFGHHHINIHITEIKFFSSASVDVYHGLKKLCSLQSPPFVSFSSLYFLRSMKIAYSIVFMSVRLFFLVAEMVGERPFP